MERGQTGMGDLFKVLAVTHEGIEAVPGLPALSPSS
jgi:NADH dehydrogenase [ubiquinone] 1 alpha subcomplex assembly factor 7